MNQDDQTLMNAMPSGRKMYRGFKMPANMSSDQEAKYKSAIDQRLSGRAVRALNREKPKTSNAAGVYNPIHGDVTALDQKLLMSEDKL
tara:strand:+ start:132 stop:395 length:264 start_codon:yes stop_codon:yes gene_type:complete